jgi:Domain of unknown function (DUF4932)
MKALLVIMILPFLSATVKAQNYGFKKVILRSSSDSFNILPFWPEKMPIVANDTSAFGTNFYKAIFTVTTDIDSASVQFDPAKKPYKQTTWIEIASRGKSQFIAINFNEMNAEFSSAYINANTGKVQFDIPETYELANVLYTLTKSSEKDNNRTFKRSAYYKHVLAFFKPYMNHPLLKELEFGYDANGAKDYYNFRENSFCFQFEKDRVIRNNQYNIVSGEMRNNLFEKLLPLINDFVRKSGFGKFYLANMKYYQSQIEQAKQIMPVRKMWNWLENNFKNKFQSYRVVLSPLIWGSHSTQQFWWVVSLDKWFGETVMFVGGPEIFDVDSSLSEKQKEEFASGMVFTEIDHNYINPVSEKYKSRIEVVFKDINKWLSPDGDAQLYQSSMAVFNEYMTHTAFVLYCFDNFSTPDFEFAKTRREDLMIKNRKYFRFKEFDEELLRLYKARSQDQKLEDLFDSILKWAAVQ